MIDDSAVGWGWAGVAGGGLEGALGGNPGEASGEVSGGASVEVLEEASRGASVEVPGEALEGVRRRRPAITPKARRRIQTRRIEMEERQWMGRGGTCLCPACGHRIPHQRGVPCQEERCPKCGKKMLREGSYHHDLLIKKKAKESGE